MSKGKKTSSSDKVKVVEAKVANPDLSTRDLERETGVSRETSRRIVRDDLGQVVSQSEVMAKLVDDNNEILNITGAKVLAKLADDEGKIRLDELLKAKDLAFKQNHLINESGKGGDDKTAIIITF